MYEILLFYCHKYRFRYLFEPYFLVITLENFDNFEIAAYTADPLTLTMTFLFDHSIQARDADIARMMKDEAKRAEEEEYQKNVEHYHESVRYQQELEKQLEEQERKKQEDYEEFLKEKLMIDEVVRKIQEEDER